MTKRLLPSIIAFSILFITKISAQQYFQQEVNYKINVKLDDSKHELQADETIEYVNNSPNTLNEIYMHLWPNAYKDNNTAMAKQLLENGSTKFYYAEEKDRGYIDGLDFKINGQTALWTLDSTYIDICKIKLTQPLAPGQRITITTPFHVKVPLGKFSRLGHLDQAYQITQWYPKPAVYDKNGWNPMPYLTLGEFYSEYGTFDVFITLPKNYVVAATGDLVDGDAELAWLNENVKQTEQIKDYPKDMKHPASDKESKTLHYHQSKVHDFAWFADKRFHVLKGEVELPYSKKKVTTWVMYTNSEPKLWKKSIPYMNDAIAYYSKWNGDYPYNHATAIDGALTAGAGMEYPNVTVIGPSNTDRQLETVIVHEVGHNWFYGILGSNERKHAWMDEGINSFNEMRYMNTKYATDKNEIDGKKLMKGQVDIGKFNNKTLKELEYQLNAARNLDQQIELPSDKFTEFNYGTIVYAKTAIVFDYLRGYLGDEAFDKAMQAYFEKWKFKHPQPEDIKASLEQSTGKKLDWIFKDLIDSTGKLDYSIRSVNGNQVTIRNCGDISSPVSIAGIKDNKIVNQQWIDGFNGNKIIDFSAIKYDKIRIDPMGFMPEINRNNNTSRTSGLFKKIEPIKLQLLYNLPNSEKTVINYLPIIGWNNYDKTMLGVAFYNSFIPAKRVEYIIAPMYSTAANTIVGGGDIGVNIYPEHSQYFHTVKVGATFERYTENTFNKDYYHFNKVSPYITWTNPFNDPRSSWSVTDRLRGVFLFKDKYNGPVIGKTQEKFSYTEYSSTWQDNSAVNPMTIKFVVGGSEDFIKYFNEINYKINYKKSTKGVQFRFFGGLMAYRSRFYNTYNFSLSGFSGGQDYMYDQTYLGRNEHYPTGGGFTNLLARQFAETEGGFKTLYNRPGLTSGRDMGDYMFTMGVKVPFPGKLPLGFFGTVGTYKDAENDDAVGKSKMLYETGLYIPFLGDLCTIYVPLDFMISDNLKSYSPMAKGKNYIRFTFNLANLNPIKLSKQLPH